MLLYIFYLGEILENDENPNRDFKRHTVKAGYNEPSVPAIFVRYRMSSLYNTYII